MSLRILKENEVGTGILIEMDAGYISPKEERNNEIIKESNQMLDHSKPFEFYAVLQKYNTPNRNGRTYPEKILRREAENYKKMIEKGVALTSTSEFFEDLSNGKGPKNSILALGYAGWGGGQIEKEILANSWMTLSADSTFLFDEEVTNKWNNAYRLLGVDPNKLSQYSGRA